MSNVVKALLIFALMLVIPVIADNLLHSRPDVPLPALQWPRVPESAVLLLLAIPATAFAIYLYAKEQDRLKHIQSCLNRAERDLNSQLSSGMEHGGRKGFAVERSEWNRMTVSPAIQIFNAGYRTPAHDLADLNEKDLAGKRGAMGKASATAMLFRELYEGSVATAQSRVMAEVRNSGNVPYIAPGISELIGFDKFDKEKGFPKGAGVNWEDLELAVKIGGFPTQNLIMVKTNAAGERTALRGNEVLLDLTQQKV
jgi:hypothetical protein